MAEQQRQLLAQFGVTPITRLLPPPALPAAPAYVASSTSSLGLPSASASGQAGSSANAMATPARASRGNSAADISGVTPAASERANPKLMEASRRHVGVIDPATAGPRYLQPALGLEKMTEEQLVQRLVELAALPSPLQPMKSGLHAALPSAPPADAPPGAPMTATDRRHIDLVAYLRRTSALGRAAGSTPENSFSVLSSAQEASLLAHGPEAKFEWNRIIPPLATVFSAATPQSTPCSSAWRTPFCSSEYTDADGVDHVAHGPLESVISGFEAAEQQQVVDLSHLPLTPAALQHAFRYGVRCALLSAPRESVFLAQVTLLAKACSLQLVEPTATTTTTPTNGKATTAPVAGSSAASSSSSTTTAAPVAGVVPLAFSTAAVTAVAAVAFVEKATRLDDPRRLYPFLKIYSTSTRRERKKVRKLQLKRLLDELERHGYYAAKAFATRKAYLEWITTTALNIHAQLLKLSEEIQELKRAEKQLLKAPRRFVKRWFCCGRIEHDEAEQTREDGDQQQQLQLQSALGSSPIHTDNTLSSSLDFELASLGGTAEGNEHLLALQGKAAHGNAFSYVGMNFSDLPKPPPVDARKKTFGTRPPLTPLQMEQFTLARVDRRRARKARNEDRRRRRLTREMRKGIKRNETVVEARASPPAGSPSASPSGSGSSGFFLRESISSDSPDSDSSILVDANEDDANWSRTPEEERQRAEYYSQRQVLLEMHEAYRAQEKRKRDADAILKEIGLEEDQEEDQHHRQHHHHHHAQQANTTTTTVGQGQAGMATKRNGTTNGDTQQPPPTGKAVNGANGVPPPAINKPVGKAAVVSSVASVKARCECMHVIYAQLLAALLALQTDVGTIAAMADSPPRSGPTGVSTNGNGNGTSHRGSAVTGKTDPKKSTPSAPLFSPNSDTSSSSSSSSGGLLFQPIHLSTPTLHPSFHPFLSPAKRALLDGFADLYAIGGVFRMNCMLHILACNLTATYAYWLCCSDVLSVLDKLKALGGWTSFERARYLVSTERIARWAAQCTARFNQVFELPVDLRTREENRLWKIAKQQQLLQQQEQERLRLAAVELEEQAKRQAMSPRARKRAVKAATASAAKTQPNANGKGTGVSNSTGGDDDEEEEDDEGNDDALNEEEEAEDAIVVEINEDATAAGGTSGAAGKTASGLLGSTASHAHSSHAPLLSLSAAPAPPLTTLPLARVDLVNSSLGRTRGREAFRTCLDVVRRCWVVMSQEALQASMERTGPAATTPYAGMVAAAGIPLQSAAGEAAVQTLHASVGGSSIPPALVQAHAAQAHQKHRLKDYLGSKLAEAFRTSVYDSLREGAKKLSEEEEVEEESTRAEAKGQEESKENGEPPHLSPSRRPRVRSSLTLSLLQHTLLSELAWLSRAGEKYFAAHLKGRQTEYYTECCKSALAEEFWRDAEEYVTRVRIPEVLRWKASTDRATASALRDSADAIVLQSKVASAIHSVFGVYATLCWCRWKMQTMEQQLQQQQQQHQRQLAQHTQKPPAEQPAQPSSPQPPSQQLQQLQPQPQQAQLQPSLAPSRMSPATLAACHRMSLWFSPIVDGFVASLIDRLEEEGEMMIIPTGGATGGEPTTGGEVHLLQQLFDRIDLHVSQLAGKPLTAWHKSLLLSALSSHLALFSLHRLVLGRGGISEELQVRWLLNQRYLDEYPPLTSMSEHEREKHTMRLLSSAAAHHQRRESAGGESRRGSDGSVTPATTPGSTKSAAAAVAVPTTPGSTPAVAPSSAGAPMVISKPLHKFGFSDILPGLTANLLKKLYELRLANDKLDQLRVDLLSKEERMALSTSPSPSLSPLPSLLVQSLAFLAGGLCSIVMPTFLFNLLYLVPLTRNPLVDRWPAGKVEKCAGEALGFLCHHLDGLRRGCVVGDEVRTELGIYLVLEIYELFALELRNTTRTHVDGVDYWKRRDVTRILEPAQMARIADAMDITKAFATDICDFPERWFNTTDAFTQQPDERSTEIARQLELGPWTARQSAGVPPSTAAADQVTPASRSRANSALPPAAVDSSAGSKAAPPPPSWSSIPFVLLEIWRIERLLMVCTAPSSVLISLYETTSDDWMTKRPPPPLPASSSASPFIASWPTQAPIAKANSTPVPSPAAAAVGATPLSQAPAVKAASVPIPPTPAVKVGSASPMPQAGSTLLPPIPAVKAGTSTPTTAQAPVPRTAAGSPDLTVSISPAAARGGWANVPPPSGGSQSAASTPAGDSTLHPPPSFALHVDVAASPAAAAAAATSNGSALSSSRLLPPPTFNTAPAGVLASPASVVPASASASAVPVSVSGPPHPFALVYLSRFDIFRLLQSRASSPTADDALAHDWVARTKKPERPKETEPPMFRAAGERMGLLGKIFSPARKE